MPSRRMTAQNKLNGIFGDVLFNNAFFEHFLISLVLCFYIMIYDFVFFYGMCVCARMCVFLVVFILVYSGLFAFLFAVCFLKRKIKKA